MAFEFDPNEIDLNGSGLFSFNPLPGIDTFDDRFFQQESAANKFVLDIGIPIGLPPDSNISAALNTASDIVKPLDPFGVNAAVRGFDKLSNNQTKTWNYFKALGFTPQSAAGIMGNLMQESTPSIDPTLKQGGGGPGRGIMQWTYSERWQSLVKYANSRGLDPNSLVAQLEYMVQEMKTYKSGGQTVYDRIKVMTDIEDATNFFEKTMERAGKPMMEKRIAYAKQVYKSFTGQ